MNNNSKINTKEILDEENLRSSALIKFVGMTYRQINDWQFKGVLQDQRKSNKKWRIYTYKEVFALMVCKEIRNKFGVPLKDLNFIKTLMLKEEANHFLHSTVLCRLGLAVILLTDLKDTFMIDNDLGIEHLLSRGYFRSKNPQQYILLKINPLINKMLELKNMPQLNIDEKVYESVDKSFQHNISTQEKEILKLIRNKSFKKVIVHLKDGNMFQVDTEEELADELNGRNNDDLLDIIESNKFQSITIQKQDNKIVRLNRKIPRKIGNKK